MKSIVREMRLAVRSLGRAPLFATVVVLTMGLGIGANTAIFSVVHSVMLRPLPFEDSGRLVWLMNRYLPSGSTGAISGAEFWEYRQSQPVLEGVVALSGQAGNLTGLQVPVRLIGLQVSPGYFELLRVQPVLGRAFLPEEEEPGRAPVMVISNGLWQRAFASDPQILGRQVQLSGRTTTVVGVMSRDYEPLGSYLSDDDEIDYWEPLVLDPASFDLRSVERHGLRVIGRLSAEADGASAERRLADAVRLVEAKFPGISNEGSRDVAVVPLRERVAGDSGGILLILTIAVGLVLLLACVNVTNLLMARGEARSAEVAVRAALGARRTELLTHALSESAVIGLAGGVVGLLLAVLGRDALLMLLPAEVEIPGGVPFGLPVLGFSLTLSLAAGLLAGVLPGMRIARGEVFASLKSGGRGHTGLNRQRLRRSLVVCQVAGAVILVSGAGLLLRSLGQLRAVDPGFDVTDVHMVQVNATSESYPDLESVTLLYEMIESRVEAIPGVESAAASWQTPLQTEMSDWPVRAELGEESEWQSADPNWVTPSYFETYAIDLVAGRYFNRSDFDSADGPVILSESAVRALFGGGQAVGRRVNVDFQEPIWREVVGVVADVKGRGLGLESRPQTYLTFAPGPFGPNPFLTLTIRSGLTSEQLRSSLVEVMAGIDPDVPIGTVKSMEEQVSASLTVERLLSTLLMAFGSMALLLGSIGVYGLMAYTVQLRRREIGLRIAMGAPRSAVSGLVVRQAMVLGAAGVTLGLFGAVAAGRVLEGFLFGVSSTDLTTLAAVSATVLGVTAISSYGPARRAASVDPLTTLKEE